MGTSVAALAPTVTVAAPIDNATGVSISAPAIQVTFNESMAPITGAATFTVTCAAPCTNATGTVALDSTNKIATFTLTPATTLSPLTQYAITVTAARSIATGLPLATPFVSHFITAGTSADSTRPRVTATSPATTTPGPTTGAPTNAAISVAFTEDMIPATITTGTAFTVTCASPCVSPVGSVVTYNAATHTAIYTPAAALAAATTYTATITTAATDMAGNALAGNQAALPASSNYIWTFTTGAAVAPANVTIVSTSPTANQTTVCPSATVNATFSTRMNPVSINAANFTVTGPASTVVTATSISIDASTGRTATFTPQSALTSGVVYTATIMGGVNGVKDLIIPANTMVSNLTWSFTAGPATGSCVVPVALATAAPYGMFGGSAGMTNTGINTVINGDIGTIATTTSSITGFHDTAADIYTESLANIGSVNGKIYTCTTSTTGPTSTTTNAVSCAVATQARLDAQTAYQALVAKPSGANPGGNLASLTLAPGVYTAPAGSFLIQGGDLTLDAQGDTNATWVFQMATTLTVGGPGAAAPQSIILANGAQAKNVFWQVGSAATINAAGGGTMVGTIISQSGAAFSTLGNTALVTLNGRALSLGASVTLVNTVINVPAP
ncbi:MAG TPA: ice-binding family protein [Steroidobacteraceae bacterium]|nr:ice-binding family protein [Steroidobacteraceae bacterium]